MTEEIKRILDDLLFTTTLPNVSIKLNKEKLNQLLDYITNLKHTEDLYNQLLKDYDELQYENERLKEKINEVVNKQQLLEEKFNYKSRIEKAVEYIEDKMELTKECPQDLLNILNGRSDE